MERTFALYSPIVDTIKVVRSGKVRRAKLYYLRDRTGKSARIAEKIKKKIGIDIETKIQQVTEENVLPATDDNSKEVPKSDASSDAAKKEAVAEAPKEEVKKEEQNKKVPQRKNNIFPNVTNYLR